MYGKEFKMRSILMVMITALALIGMGCATTAAHNSDGHHDVSPEASQVDGAEKASCCGSCGGGAQAAAEPEPEKTECAKAKAAKAAKAEAEKTECAKTKAAKAAKEAKEAEEKKGSCCGSCGG